MQKSDIALQLTLRAMERLLVPNDKCTTRYDINNRTAENIAEMYKIIYSSIKENDD
ncbi:hypothetical protein GOQ29_06000 [Clostridium sp. D2Q-14]|uniref:hypothetical protein n=1 Tax=Anaeromonas gelatinilytica TaxID=2683194 RepID=UPI00193C238E|nr:hypothetical protein [Anaeromonas gelatinilytica]MBS4535172.1 hypothetical protein [Anaeromonas gelatinilytica]